MTTKRGGRKYKDAKITEGFNKDKIGVTKKVMAQAKRVLAAQKKLSTKPVAQKYSRKKKPVSPPSGQPDTNLTVTGYDEDGWPVFASETPVEAMGEKPFALVEDEDDDETSAQKMLSDMRWAYKKNKGRNKLQLLMAQDKEFMGMVKELMKAEISIITNKAKGGGSRQGFFVVLKGLETEKPIVKLTEDMRNKAPIDIGQIERALNPAADRTEMEEERDQRGGPAEIVKKVEGIESVEGW
uniref:Uncharacterized protein n=1 Tax=viral metagenome TaxID=1070528 RepID=A0A6M3JJA5_9ZZZZ